MATKSTIKDFNKILSSDNSINLNSDNLIIFSGEKVPKRTFKRPPDHSHPTLGHLGICKESMKIQEWIAKWSKPHWMPQDPRLIVKNLTPEHIGQLNLMWVFLGRKPITQGFFDQNLSVWELAGRISVQSIYNISVREYATLYTEDEFYRFVCQHPDVFGRYLTMAMWKKHFAKKRQRTASVKGVF